MTVISMDSYKSKKKVKENTKKYDVMTIDDVNNWLEEDIQKLMKATGLDHEHAIKMASDFYRLYPALIEHVRSYEFMANNK